MKPREPTAEVTKIVVKCKICTAAIEITPPSLPDDIPQYATVITRANVLCQQCFRWLSRR